MYADAVARLVESIFPVFYVDPQSELVGVCGTGFFIDDGGLFLTSEHVMASPPPGATAYYYGRTPDEVCEPLEFERVASEPARDLYVGRMTPGRPVELSDEPVRPGDAVCLSGYPMAVLDVSDQGLVGNVRRYWQPTFAIDATETVIDGRTYHGYIVQHACLPGMSGGPGVDTEGRGAVLRGGGGGAGLGATPPRPPPPRRPGRTADRGRERGRDRRRAYPRV